MANITRFSPFSEMVTLRDAMDRLFEDSIVSPMSWRTLAGDALSPAIDVHQTPEEIVVSAALPGVKADDVNITITGQTLSLRGEFKGDESVTRDQVVYRERRYGAFHRQLQLPVRVRSEGATAAFEDGILTLRIPKAEEVKPRQIEVKATPKPVGPATNGDAAA